MTNNGPQNITQKTKKRDWTQMFRKVSSSCSLMQEEFEDTKEVIKIRISKTNRQRNDQKKMYKGTNNDLQNKRSSNTNPTKNH